MFKITILIDTEQGKDDILNALEEAEFNGEISESFGTYVDEISHWEEAGVTTND